MGKSEHRNLLFVGFLVGDEDERRISMQSPVLATQTHRFGWNIVEALVLRHWRVSSISAHPVPSFPRYPQLIFRGGSFKERGVEVRAIPFINLLGAKHLTRFLSALLMIPRACKASGATSILIHGAHSPYLCAALVLRRRLGVKVFAYVTDPPSLYSGAESRLAHMLKKCDRLLIRSMLNMLDGIVVVALPLAVDFAPRARCLVLPGFSTRDRTSAFSKTEIEGEVLRIAYAGGLLEEYGVDTLIQAFASLADPHLELHIYGSGPLDSKLQAFAAEFSNIFYHGYIAHDKLLGELASMDVLLNPRPVDAVFVRYSFPSKVLEYLSLGVPLVSTDLPSFPDSMAKFYTSFGSGSFSEIKQVLADLRTNYDLLMQRARGGQEWVQNALSSAAAGVALEKFILSSETEDC